MIRPLAWEPPYAEGTALKNKQKKKKEEDFHVILNCEILYHNWNYAFMFVFQHFEMPVENLIFWKKSLKK